MTNKGHCKHGDFILIEGCPQCIAERDAEKNPYILKVQYYSETTGELSSREYTYYSVDCLNVGDVVIVPVRDTKVKAKVSAIDISAAEIINFKDKVKTIPSGSVIMKEPEPELSAEPEIPYEDEAKLALFEAEPLTETALALRPGEDIEAHGYYEEALKLKEYAESRVIATVEDIKMATDDLSIISKIKKAMEEKRKEYLSPLQDQVKQINETYKTLMEPILLADQLTRAKVIAFQAEQERIRREQEEINRKRMEAAQAEMQLKGELSELVNLVEVSPEVPKRVDREMGTLGQRDNWKYEVVDFALLPDEYKVADTTLLNSIAKKHHDRKQIPGVRFYNEPIITVATR